MTPDSQPITQPASHSHRRRWQVISRLALLLVFMLPLAACGTTPAASPVIGVPYPTGYRETFVKYATVDRRDGVVRDLYIHPEALARIVPGRALPQGTIIVIEAYDALRDADGDLVRDASGWLVRGAMHPQIHIAEKRPDWRPEDFELAALSDDWNFGSYAVATGTRFDEQLTACFNCHNATEHADFTWSLPLLLAFARSGRSQYVYCDLTGRIPCEL